VIFWGFWGRKSAGWDLGDMEERIAAAGD